ncbi:putative signal peptide and transmembrane protein [Rhodopirellula islandica]|uniref:Signal peptide and transmembrane protein n=1 Tax=Rhodopirellula islandica TaxID=595434 RepID=A0A0J1BAI7_RHOIS|nr:putative signal peptide and transmembrane protein [Rhodopirellula islandica]
MAGVIFTGLLSVMIPTVSAERPRLAVLTDIGGDPDDTQSLVRLLVYSNEFEIEALIASASGTRGELKESITRPDLIHELIDAYEHVRPNLQQHAKGWPEADALRGVVVSGNPNRERPHIGEGHDTDGSRLLIKRIDAGSVESPLCITVWGGQTDLAQALDRVQATRGPDGFAAFVRKFSVYDIADQDGIANWMRKQFPGMHYVLSTAAPNADKRTANFRGMYLTGDESLTGRNWIEANVRSKGPLGALYPTKTWTAPNPHGCLKEGDTPSWFFFLPKGGNDPKDPSQPGWGGEFTKQDDGWYRDRTATTNYDPRTSVSRWRPEFQADFAKRMQWCLPATE